jgi:YebC/PmpR family DNA-binding regulatory protein
MSGHSKWANIKHRKAKVDAQRANVFTKLGRAIFAAARQGGGDPNTNMNLKLAVANARVANMPVDNISRLITRATGEAEGVNYEEALYEGYAAGGVAVLVQILTDNRNRTAPEIRYLFSRNGGNLGESGCVAWMFELKGLLQVPSKGVPGDSDELMLDLIEIGAEDVREEDKLIEIVTAPQDFDRIKTYLDESGIKYSSADLTMIPKTTVPVNDVETAERVLKLLDALDEQDDVQNVYANFDIPDEVLNRIDSTGS